MGIGLIVCGLKVVFDVSKVTQLGDDMVKFETYSWPFVSVGSVSVGSISADSTNRGSKILRGKKRPAMVV